MNHRLKLLITRLYNAISGVVFNVKLTYMNRKYGKGNIPQEEVGKLLGDIDDFTFHVMKFAGALGQLSEIMGNDIHDWSLTNDITLLLNSRMTDKQLHDELVKLIERSDKKQAVLGELRRRDDIKDHQYVYHAEKINAWLEE